MWVVHLPACPTFLLPPGPFRGKDVGRGPAAPWIAGASHAEPGVRQEAPVEPPLGGLGASRRWSPWRARGEDVQGEEVQGARIVK